MAPQNKNKSLWKILDSLGRLTAIREGQDFFGEMPLPPLQDKVYKVRRAHACGKWGDDAIGKQVEGISCSEKTSRVGRFAVLAAHYGWARTLKKKHGKTKVCFGEALQEP